MHKITTGNLRTTKNGIRCDRISVLGNPFEMGNERQRDAVCDAFDEYLEEVLKTSESVEIITNKIAQKYKVGIARAWKVPTKVQIKEELAMLQIKLAQGPLTLLCWCNPKRCHVNSIAKILEGK